MNQNEFRALHHKLICEYKWKKKGNGRLVRINYGLVVMFSLWNCILIVNSQVKIARSWLLIETQIIHHHWVVVSVLIEHSFVHVQNNYIICSFIHSRPQHVAYNMFFFHENMSNTVNSGHMENVKGRNTFNSCWINSMYEYYMRPILLISQELLVLGDKYDTKGVCN